MGLAGRDAGDRLAGAADDLADGIARRSRRPHAASDAGALASVIAAEMLAVTWIVFGNTRLSLRIVPLLVLIASHMVVLTVVFHEQPWIVWHASKCAGRLPDDRGCAVPVRGGGQSGRSAHVEPASIHRGCGIVVRGRSTGHRNGR